MKDIKITVGQNIRKYRIKKKLTQVELAEKAKIAYKYLQKIEGRTPPNLTIKSLQNLSKELGINVAALFK